MSALSELRKKYPQYNDLSDQELADKYHSKFYSDMPKEDYYSKIGLSSQTEQEPQTPQGFKGIAHEAYETVAEPFRHPISSLANTISGLASETYGLGKQALGLPFEALSGHIPRLTKNVAQGFENIVNTPANLAGYLGKHGIGFPADIAEKAHIKVNPFEMGEPQAGDIVAQALPSIAALGPLGEAGELSQIGRAGARAATGGGIGLTQNQNPILTAIMNSIIPAAIEKTPGITNKSIGNLLSKNKEEAISTATKDYNNFFDKAKNSGIQEIERPSINAGNIIKNSSKKYHQALQKFMDNPTLENAHWAQSDLGFLKRHLEKIESKQHLTSSQQQTLKNVIEAQNRIKTNMFKNKSLTNKDELVGEYNQLADQYKQNVVPLKELEELSDYENKQLTANNLIKSLLKNDRFMLGIGKNYPQLHINAALRSNPAKIIAGTALGGLTGGAIGKLGYEIGKQFLK